MRLLERDAEALAQRALVGRPPHAQDLDVARRRVEEPFEDLDRGGLARAVRTEQAEAFAGVHLEVEPVERERASLVLLHETATHHGSCLSRGRQREHDTSARARREGPAARRCVRRAHGRGGRATSRGLARQRRANPRCSTRHIRCISPAMASLAARLPPSRSRRLCVSPRAGQRRLQLRVRARPPPQVERAPASARAHTLVWATTAEDAPPSTYALADDGALLPGRNGIRIWASGTEWACEVSDRAPIADCAIAKEGPQRAGARRPRRPRASRPGRRVDARALEIVTPSPGRPGERASSSRRGCSRRWDRTSSSRSRRTRTPAARTATPGVSFAVWNLDEGRAVDLLSDLPDREHLLASGKRAIDAQPDAVDFSRPEDPPARDRAPAAHRRRTDSSRPARWSPWRAATRAPRAAGARTRCPRRYRRRSPGGFAASERRRAPSGSSSTPTPA